MLLDREIRDLFFSFTLAKTTEELWRKFQNFAKAWDLKHVRITVFSIDDPIGLDTAVHVKSWPPSTPDWQSWADYYQEQTLFTHDRSFHLIFEQRIEYMLWSRMEDLVRSNSEASRVFTEMRDFGIGEGVLCGKSSLIHGKTALLGIAGSSSTFKSFKGDLWRPLVHCFHVFLNCYLELAIEEDVFSEPPMKRFDFTSRELEVLRELSLDVDIPETANRLGISIDGVNGTLRRLRHRTGIKKPAAMVAHAFRTGQLS